MKKVWKRILCAALSAALLTGGVPAGASATEADTGRWLSGEYHTHTRQSNDATEGFMKVENVLDVAFREEAMGSLPAETQTGNIRYGQAFDYLCLADHLRVSVADGQGNANSPETPRYVGIRQQQEEIKRLQAAGDYEGKIIYSGFEWDTPGLDHSSVALLDASGEVPVEGIHEFEWLYGNGDNKDPDSLYAGDGFDETAEFGPRVVENKESATVEDAVSGVEWIEENYPGSYALLNHPSRHGAGTGKGVVTAEAIRRLNDAAPSVVFGFEGMPGNQMSRNDRAEYEKDNTIYGGADVMIAEVGGIWDSLLGEGRRFYNFANSDFHFKISTNQQYSSGYWPSEYSRNYTFVEGGTYADVVQAMREGKSFAVYGDLIDALDFTAASGEHTAMMGGSLETVQGETVTLTIRFRVPEQNNYAPLNLGDTADPTISSTPQVDHIDLISGEVRGKLDTEDYGTDTNETTRVVKRFTKEELGEPDAEGCYTVTYEAPADTDRYYRLRGTNLETDAAGYTRDGEPLPDDQADISSFDKANDHNYAGLWFYSNPIFVETAPKAYEGFENGGARIDVTQLARYVSGDFNADGGCEEIVKYNKADGCFYAVNGARGVLDKVSLAGLDAGAMTEYTAGDAEHFDLSGAAEALDESFTYGDMTSVDIHDGVIAVALQDADYRKPGRVAIIDGTDGSIRKLYRTGIQPDMVTFSPDGAKLLTADEGEPREGYGADTVDPAGSVTVIDLAKEPGSAETVVGFTQFDGSARQSLVDAGVVLKKGTEPSVDLEPEYLACAGSTAYVSLQENNAVAVLDFSGAPSLKGVYPLGMQDYSQVPVALDSGNPTGMDTYDTLRGIKMPDAVAVYQSGGKTFLLTANEGDSRAWGDEKGANSNEEKSKTSPSGAITTDKKVTYFKSSDYDGLEAGLDYVFGGRSFSIYEVNGDGLALVFDSGSEMEEKTRELFPDFFNCSNDNQALGDRNGKKGPEIETVTTGTIGTKTYAFATLERTGGVMVYDITNPTSSSYVNYINSRDFSHAVHNDGDEILVSGDDVSPEGLCFVEAAESPTGSPLLLAACEVSGTVAAYGLNQKETAPPAPAPAPKPEPGNTVSKTETESETVLTVTNGEGETLMELTLPKEPGAGKEFRDVAETDWYRGSVDYVSALGLVQGTTETTFSPDARLSRAELTAILYRLSGLPVYGADERQFDDVASGVYYEQAANWAGATGVVMGTDVGFQPQAGISRQDLALILYRFAKLLEMDTETLGSLDKFSDGEQVAGYAEKAVRWAVAAGLLQGSGGRLNPADGATRAEAAAILERFIKLI